MPKKKTKKQREEEKKKKDEEDARIAEEERVIAEEERKKREEEERIRKELEEKMRQEELARLGLEQSDVKRRSERIESLTTDSDEQKQDNDDWQKYTGCDHLPDPSDERDLTTHLRLWEEAKDTTLKQCIQNCNIAEKINDKILGLYYEAVSEFQADKVEWCDYYVDHYRQMCRTKFDEITKHIMDHIEEFIVYSDKEKEELKQQSKKADNMKQTFIIQDQQDSFKIGIYGNTSKILRPLPLEFNEIGAEIELPRVFQSLNNILRVTWVASDDMSTSYSPYISVGGVLNIECFKFPELPKKHRNWVMRNISEVDEMLKRRLYPDPNANTQNIDPIAIKFTIPKYVYIDETREDVEVGWWDEHNQEWNLEEFNDVKINKTAHEVSFQTMRLAPFAYLQSRTTDYPYESWKLRCISEDVALLDLKGKRINLTFEIGADYVSLIERDEPELQHLVDRKLHPGMVLKILSRSGIHLLPDDKDYKLAEIEPKDRDSEERAIWDVVCCINAFSFRSAKWNKNPQLKDNIVIKIRENLEYDREFFEDYEPDWNYVMWWQNKCGFVDCTDLKEDFEQKANLKGDHVTHALLNLAIAQNSCSEEAIERCNSFQHIRFMQTLKKFLRLLRLFSFG